MLINPPPAVFRKSNRRRKPKKPAALTLVSVTWDDSEGILALTFDRAIRLDGFDTVSVRLMDGVTTNMVLAPYPPVEVDGATLSMGVADVEPYAGSDVLLTVIADSEIFAVDNDVQFAGVTDLEVPFP